MADVPYSTLNGVQRMMIEMPDGTHAERLVAVNADGTPIGGSGDGAGGASLTDAQLRAAAVVMQDQWEDGTYTLDSGGSLVSETQIHSSTGATRTRTWTYATTGGNTVATPGAWA